MGYFLLQRQRRHVTNNQKGYMHEVATVSVSQPRSLPYIPRHMLLARLAFQVSECGSRVGPVHVPLGHETALEAVLRREVRNLIRVTRLLAPELQQRTREGMSKQASKHTRTHKIRRQVKEGCLLDCRGR